MHANNDLVKIWPEVLAENVDNDLVELQLHIPFDLDYFQGHFPNAPILAGVVQLHWAVEYCKQKFSLTELEVKNVEVLKFQVVIIPGQKLNLALTRKTVNKVLFSYTSEKGQHASGRIVFEDTW
jgi:3-hydroxymyristoyl/3-hydroxydecanoyl-(acyl carrier protein) dehydratase